MKKNPWHYSDGTPVGFTMTAEDKIAAADKISRERFLKHVETCKKCVLGKKTRNAKHVCKKAMSIVTAFEIFKSNLTRLPVS